MGLFLLVADVLADTGFTVCLLGRATLLEEDLKAQLRIKNQGILTIKTVQLEQLPIFPGCLLNLGRVKQPILEVLALPKLPMQCKESIAIYLFHRTTTIGR